MSLYLKVRLSTKNDYKLDIKHAKWMWLANLNFQSTPVKAKLLMGFCSAAHIYIYIYIFLISHAILFKYILISLFSCSIFILFSFLLCCFFPIDTESPRVLKLKSCSGEIFSALLRKMSFAQIDLIHTSVEKIIQT